MGYRCLPRAFFAWIVGGTFTKVLICVESALFFGRVGRDFPARSHALKGSMTW
jgi:hypothetical protein